MRKKKYNRLIELRDDIRDAMKKALAEEDMVAYHKLNGHLIRIEYKIRKGTT